MSTQEDRNPTAEQELLSFRVAEQEYSVDIMAVREIRGWAKATPLPRAPAYVCGVINLRGTVLPIVDLAARLGLERCQRTDRDVIIVVQIRHHTLGLLVEAVSDILAIPRDALQPPPEMSAAGARGFVSALTIHEGRMIRVLDLDKVLPEDRSEAA